MADWTPEQTAITVVIGMWAAVNTVFAGVKILNERRDFVVTASDGKNHLSKKHRTIILYNDWVPMVICTCAACLMFGALLIYLATERSNSEYYWIYIACAIVASIVCFSLIFGSIWEFNFMRQEIAKTDEIKSTAEGDQTI